MSFKQLSPAIKPFLKPAETGFFENEQNPPYSSLAELKSALVSCFEFKDKIEGELPKPAEYFAKIVSNLHIPDLIQDIFDTTVIQPADILMLMPREICNVFVAIALIFRDLHGSPVFLSWITKLIVPSDWHNYPTVHNSHLMYLDGAYLKGLFRKHKNPSWLLYDNNKVLHVQGIHHNFDDATVPSPAVEQVIHEVVSVTSIDDPKNTIKLVFDSQASAENFSINLINPPPFPHTLVPFHKPYPTIVLKAFSEALVSTDMYVLRSILSYNVMSIMRGKQYIPHLVRVFSYHGHMQRLLTAFAGLEFTNESLTQNTVLRANSHLTTLFKYYSENFGANYFNNVIKPICFIIDSAGDIGWKSGSPNLDLPKLSKILLASLEKIVTSIQFVPIEMRHMAHVLKMGLLARFQTRRAVFNILCGFFCLRFMTASLLSPSSFEPDMILQSDKSLTLIPFAQILQALMNLETLENQFDFDPQTEKNIRVMLCRIYNFVMEIPELDGKEIHYKVPTELETMESLEELLELIADKKNEFVSNYKNLMADTNDMSPACWRIAEFIVHCFDE
ncbi:GTPase-activator protein [Histomonas meleagridis]|uniref:GTPase-activator protein n=1 Tax=Histomonas meleagridis TaxID=135588 RepID=UPI003559D829|nr:GTPase-activator protein [Histomonas meleagridis]KAH0796263.1 GTPase-activator protein [Histomonas meleagridis]